MHLPKQLPPGGLRVVVPNHAHHIVQRGHNRQVVLADDDDYSYYLGTLGACKEVYGVKVYDYCLMTNHVHLILEPPEDIAVFGRLMKRLAGRQTRYVNRLQGRSGTLREGRYKLSPIQTGECLLACCRYADLNPVGAHMVPKPQDYQWSSYNAKAGLVDSDWLDFDSLLASAMASNDKSGGAVCPICLTKKPKTGTATILSRNCRQP